MYLANTRLSRRHASDILPDSDRRGRIGLGKSITLFDLRMCVVVIELSSSDPSEKNKITLTVIS